MRPYFRTLDRVRELEREASEWIGTPWLPGSCLKHHGTDCGHFAAGLYAGCNAHPLFTIPRIISFTSRQTESLVIWLSSFERLRRVDNRHLNPGDLLIFRGTHVHMAVVLTNDQIVHALSHGGVQYGSAKDPTLMGHLFAIFEVIQPQS